MVLVCLLCNLLSPFYAAQKDRIRVFSCTCFFSPIKIWLSSAHTRMFGGIA
jgi:hypothetical protein